MALPNIFRKEVSDKVIHRINLLKPATEAQWGKMNVSQMLAHNNVMYEMLYEEKHAKPNFLMKLVLKAFVKPIVVSEKPYKHNSKTAPAFMINEPRNFQVEKNRLVAYIEKTQQLGEDAFESKDSLSFGPLSKEEWNNMFYKHLDHHLTQFGV